MAAWPMLHSGRACNRDALPEGVWRGVATVNNDASEIAAKVLALEETEVLVLRLPQGMAFNDAVFANFRAQLKALLPESLVKGRLRVVVLTHDMSLECLEDDDLERAGLRRREQLDEPYKSPEKLFDAGPLRQAARAGWAAALGRVDEANVHTSTAKAGYAADLRQRERIQVRSQ